MCVHSTTQSPHPLSPLPHSFHRSGLQRDLQKMEASIEHTKTRLSEYQQADSAYLGLVRAYGHIQSKISQAQEDVDRIRRG